MPRVKNGIVIERSSSHQHCLPQKYSAREKTWKRHVKFELHQQSSAGLALKPRALRWRYPGGLARVRWRLLMVQSPLVNRSLQEFESSIFGFSNLTTSTILWPLTLHRDMLNALLIELQASIAFTLGLTRPLASDLCIVTWNAGILLFLPRRYILIVVSIELR